MATSARTLFVFLVCLAGCISIGVAGSLGVGAAHQSAFALDSVKELEKPVTYAESKIPLGELVQKVARDTGADVRVAADIAEEPVAVAVILLPARELLDQLGELLDYRWSRRGPIGSGHYEMWQDLAGKQKEIALREAAFGDCERRFREAVQRCVRMASLPPEQIRSIRDTARRQRQEMQKLTREQRASLVRSGKARDRDAEFQIADQLLSPLRRSLALLVGRLSPQQWKALETKPIIFSTDARAAELNLPQDVARTLRSSSGFTPQEFLNAEDPGVRESAQQRERQTQQRWAASNEYRVTVRLDVDPRKTGGSSKGPFSLTVTAEALDSSRAGQRALISGGLSTTLFITALMLDYPLQQWSGEDTQQRRAMLRQDPIVGTARKVETTVKARVDPDGPGSGSQWSFWDLMPDLARVYGVHLISDAYWSPSPVAFPSSIEKPVALFTLLDGWTGHSHRWDRRGNVIRLRSRTWFFDRRREVPLRLVRRWKELVARSGALPLREYLDSVVTLDDTQLDSLPGVVPQAQLPPDLLGLSRARHALRLYGSLTLSQQQALLRGHSMPVAQMKFPQRSLFLSGIRETARIRSTPPNLQQTSVGNFSVRSRQATRIVDRRGEMIRYRTDSEPLPSRRPGEAPAPGSPVAPTSPGVSSTRSSVPRFPVTELEFRFSYGPGKEETVPLTVAGAH